MNAYTFEPRSDSDPPPRGRQDRRPQLPDRAQAVRGQLAGAAGARLHRARAVRRGVVPHDARVLQGVPRREVRMAAPCCLLFTKKLLNGRL